MSPSGFVHEKHDIGILRSDGSTKVGLMLRRNRSEVPAYQVFDRKNLADQFFTGVPNQQYQDPEEELPIIQQGWRSGLGLEIYDSADTERYRRSTMDMRFKGMAIAGAKPTAVTFPAGTSDTATIVNGDMELTTGWLDAGAQSAVQAHGGTYSWLITNGVDAYQDATTWATSWQGAYVTLTGWIWANANNDGRIGINDGVDTTWSDYHAGTSGWVSFTVNKNLGAAATRLRIYLGDEGVGNVYFDDVTVSITALSGQPLTGVDFNNAHYLAAGNILSKLNAGGTAFAIVAGLPAKITDLEVFGSNLFIALGTSTDYEYMNTSEAFTVSNAATKRFKYFKQVTAATPVLWGSDGDNTIRSNTNPVNGGAAWSGQTTVASSADAITGLHTDAGSLYITKEDIPYYLDSTGAVKNDLAPELATLPQSTDNGKSANFWLHNFYLTWGQSLLEYDGGVNTWRSPNDYSTNISDYAGQVFAVAGDDRYLYCIVDNSTSVEVLSGRLETIGSTTKWVWHNIAEITLTGCEACWVSSIYQKRLWIASTASSDSIYYIPLPLAYGNILADTNRAFLTGTTFETSWLHGEFRSEQKSFIKLTLEMGHAYDADIYFTVKYKKIGDSGWTTIGNFTGSATSMIQSRYIPVDASSNKPTASLFQLQFTAVTDDTTKTPVLLNYNLKAVLYLTPGTIISAKVYCANEIELKDGTKDGGSYAAIIATLDEAHTATYPITIYDIAGDTKTVRCLSLPQGVPHYKVIGNEKNRQIEREYNLLMEIIPVS